MFSRLRYWWFAKRNPLYYIDMSGLLLMEPPDPRLVVGGAHVAMIRQQAERGDELAIRLVNEGRITRA